MTRIWYDHHDAVLVTHEEAAARWGLAHDAGTLVERLDLECPTALAVEGLVDLAELATGPGARPAPLVVVEVGRL